MTNVDAKQCGGVPGSEGAGAEAQERHSGQTPREQFFLFLLQRSSGFPPVTQPPPQINEDSEVWVQSEGEPRSEQGVSREGFLETVHLI